MFDAGQGRGLIWFVSAEIVGCYRDVGAVRDPRGVRPLQGARRGEARQGRGEWLLLPAATVSLTKFWFCLGLLNLACCALVY